MEPNATLTMTHLIQCGDAKCATLQTNHARVLLVLKGVLEEDDLALKAAAELVYDDVPAQPAQGGA
jgi:hypothetical protein